MPFSHPIASSRNVTNSSDEHQRGSGVGAERPQHHDAGEDGPAQQIKADGLGRSTADSGSESRQQQCGEGEPEGAVRGECGSAEGIAAAELPHAGRELGDTAVEHCQADDHKDVAFAGKDSSVD